MEDRTLPEWMIREPEANPDRVHSSQDQGGYKKNVLEDDLPFLEFGGTVIYSQEKNDCSFLVEDLRSALVPGSVVGFDLEWPPSFIKGKSKKVALVQLCISEEKCYLFHIASMSGFPTSLKTLLEDENIKKVGVGIEGDKWKLLSDYEIKLLNFVELSSLANKRLKCVEKWSLDGLVKHLFKKQLFKEKDVRCSQWDDFGLTEEQKLYAATDAYAGLIIYRKLDEMLNSDSIKIESCLKDKLSHLGREIKDIAQSIPEGLNFTSRTQELVEDISQHVASLRDLLMSTKKTSKTEQRSLNNIGHSLKPQDAESHVIAHNSQNELKAKNGNIPSNRDGKSSSPQEKKQNSCASVPPSEHLMPLDITEYDLQMLEMQAMQEEKEEQSILAFEEQVGKNDSSEQSFELEDDYELDDEMIQCADEMEKLNNSGNSSVSPDEEEEVVEEEEAEGFDSSFPQPDPEHISCLKTYFGHHGFKPVQWKVIYTVLEQRRDNLVVMATGYGKSLCFQFPPVFCKKLSVVICPLIALMEDQVFQLQMSNISACFLGSAQTDNVYQGLLKGQYRVVYMTPEFCSGNISLLNKLNQVIGISLIAVDEAHCISQWGHDFRSAYRDLGKLKRSIPDVPIVALTATASPSIRDDIVRSLHLVNPLVTCTTFDRPNLYLDVNRKSGNILKDFKDFLVKANGGDYELEGSAIVYCPSKKEAERTSASLHKLGIRCGVYHAGLSIKKRKETQYQFMRDEIQCVVATVAFGMGINKPDIRKVIHYGAPKEMESYYQEIGRAGRDGLPSACHVLWTNSDMALNRFLLNQIKSERFRGYKMEMMAKMEKYLNSTKCRRKLILSHFEDKQLRKVTSGIMGTNKCCDNCISGSLISPSQGISEQALQDFGTCAYQLMGAVNAMGGKFGITAPILLLRGSTAQKVPERLRKHSLFGAGKSISEVWWRALSRELLSERYLTETSGFNRFSTLCKLTPKGTTWLSNAKDEKHRTLLLQPNKELCLRVVAPSRTATAVQDNFSQSTSQQTGFRSQLDANKVVKTLSNFRAVPSPSLTPVAKSQPPVVSARETKLQGELYSKLVTERQKLANKKDIPPAILATNKILLDMAKLRPCTITKLKMVDGVSEAKAGMLAPLLETVTEFCKMHGLQEADASSSTTSCAEQSDIKQQGRSSTLPLSDSVAVTYRLFQTEGKTMRQVADARTLPMPVIESHLLQALNANLPLDMEQTGLSSSIFNSITRILSSSALCSDLSDFRRIRALISEDISTFHLRLSVAKLQKEGFPNPQPPTPLSQKEHLTWIEPQEKHDQLDVPGRTLSSGIQTNDVDSMEMSEDALFCEVPMPEDTAVTDDDVLLNVEAEKPSCGINLASWNRDDVDKDTQDLFSDSPVKTLSQQSKRKLPEWIEVPQNSQTAAAAASKKPKKKKGLFM